MSGANLPRDPSELLRRLDVAMADPGLVRMALTHRSYAFENGGIDTNERLEFLGDAVLALVITDTIYAEHPGEAEGRLAKLRAAAVKAQTLAAVADDIDLGDYVLLGKGEDASGGRSKDSILADTLEAVLGAIYLDQGFDIAARVISDLFDPRLEQLAGRGAALDFKTSLQELSASEYDVLPSYELDDDGPDHQKTFTATVRIDGKVLGSGTGRSKKRAEQAAAREAYLRLTGGTSESARVGVER